MPTEHPYCGFCLFWHCITGKQKMHRKHSTALSEGRLKMQDWRK